MGMKSELSKIITVFINFSYPCFFSHFPFLLKTGAGTVRRKAVAEGGMLFLTPLHGLHRGVLGDFFSPLHRTSDF